MNTLNSSDEKKLWRLSLYQQEVLRLLTKVPKGKVTTYGALAKALAKKNPRWSPKAARAVGTAMVNNPCAPQIPCHRVIKSDGSIGKFMGGAIDGPEKKIAMLVKEGVEVKNRKVDLEKFGYFFED